MMLAYYILFETTMNIYASAPPVPSLLTRKQQEAQLSLGCRADRTGCHCMTLKFIQNRWFSFHLKKSMPFPISAQQQRRPYVAPFSHNTSVTERQTDDNNDKGSTFKLAA